MKKAILYLLPILLFVSIIYIAKNGPFKENILGSFTSQVSSTPPPTPQPLKRVVLDYEGGLINIDWFEADPTKTFLIPNLENRLTSKEAQEKNSCISMINGGFYSKDDKPVGLFINDDGMLSKWRSNNLLNGILSINYLQVPRITRTEPKDILRIGLQTGPMLKENGSFLPLKLVTDAPKRRMIAFVTGENKLYFAAFYDPSSSFVGPNLRDLPDSLQRFEKEAGLEIADAINLDGGTASSFYSGETSLPEITFSGSFFCVSS